MNKFDYTKIFSSVDSSQLSKPSFGDSKNDRRNKMDGRNDASVVIWLKNGSTAKFTAVTNFDDEISVLTFTYFSKEDLVFRHAVFSKTELVGYSFDEK